MYNKLVVTFEEDTLIVADPYTFIFHNWDDLVDFLTESGCWDINRWDETLQFKNKSGFTETHRIDKARMASYLF